MYQSSIYKGCLRCCHYQSSYGCVSKCNPITCQFYDKNADKEEDKKAELKKKYEGEL